MSLGDLYNSGNQSDSNTNVYCNSINTDSLTAATLNCVDLNASGNVTAGVNIVSTAGDITCTAGDIVCTAGDINCTAGSISAPLGPIISKGGQFSDNVLMTGKSTGSGNSTPAPTIAIASLVGTVTIAVNADFLDGTTIVVTLTNSEIAATAVCLLSMGPFTDAVNATIDIGTVSISAGEVVVTINNATGATISTPTSIVFQYLIV